MSTQEITTSNQMQEVTPSAKKQYALWQIVGIWLAAGAPLVSPTVAPTTQTVSTPQAIQTQATSREALGVSMPHFKSLKSYVDNPPKLS